MSQTVFLNPVVTAGPTRVAVGNGTLAIDRLSHFTVAQTYTLTCIAKSPDTLFAVVGSLDGAVGIANVGTQFFDEELKVFLTIQQGSTVFEIGDQFFVTVGNGTDLNQQNIDTYDEWPQKNFGAGLMGVARGDHNLRFSNTALSAFLYLHDLKFTAVATGNAGNSITITYVNDGTAGAETVGVSVSAITVHMKSGVSTATQIKAALDGTPAAVALISTTIVGTGAAPQFATGATATLSGGKNKNYAFNHDEFTDSGSFLEGNGNIRMRDARVAGNAEIQGQSFFGGSMMLADTGTANVSGPAVGNVQKYVNRLIKRHKEQVSTVTDVMLAWTSPNLTSSANIEIYFRDSAIKNTIDMTGGISLTDGQSAYVLLNPEVTGTVSTLITSTVPTDLHAWKLCTRVGTNLIMFNGAVIATTESSRIGNDGSAVGSIGNAVVRRDANGDFAARDVTVEHFFVSPTDISGVQEGIRLTDNGAGANEGLYVRWASNGKTDQIRMGQLSQATGSAWYVSTNPANSGTPIERLRITPAGNVGISIDPLVNFHVKNPLSASTFMRLEGGTGDNSAVIQLLGSTTALTSNWRISNNAVLSGSFELAQQNGGTLAAPTFANPAFLIDPTGNVGINTSGLAPLTKLEIRGAGDTGPAASGTVPNGIFSIRGGAGTALYSGLYTANGTWVQAADPAALGTNHNITFQPNGGNVGIGTQPTDILDILRTQNANTKINVRNASAGATASTGIQFTGDAASADLIYYGSGVTPSSFVQPSGFLLRGNGSGGVHLVAAHASGYIAMYTAGTEKVRIDINGNVGVNTPTPNIAGWGRAFTFISPGSSAAEIGTTAVTNLTALAVDFITSGNTTNKEVAQIAAVIANGGGSPTNVGANMLFYTKPDGGSMVERMRVNSDGQVIIGLTTAISSTANLQIAGGDVQNCIIAQYSSNANAAYWDFRKSRSATVGTNVAVSNGDQLGGMRFRGVDTATNMIEAVRIGAFADGAPGSAIVPGRFTVSTASAAGTLTERMRIDSLGNIGFGIAPDSLVNMHLKDNVDTCIFRIEGTGTNAAVIQFLGDTNTIGNNWRIGNNATITGALEIARVNGGTISGPTFASPTFIIGTLDNIGVNESPSANHAFIVSNQRLTGTQQRGIRSDLFANSAATANIDGFYSSPGTIATTGTVSNVAGFHAANFDATAGRTAIIQNGFFADVLSAGTSNNFAFVSNQTTSQNGSFAFYGAGNAPSVFGGFVGVGNLNANTTIGLWVRSAALTSANQNGIATTPTFTSVATTAAHGIQSNPTTAAASFTLPLMGHFYAAQNTLGAGSAVTREVAFYTDGITLGTNNAILADNASFTGNWFINSTSSNPSLFSGAVTMTSTLATSDNISITKANDPKLDIIASTGANRVLGLRMTNTGGLSTIGVEPSTGNAINTGGTAFALALQAGSGRVIEFGYNNGAGVALRIETTNATSVLGTLSAAGISTLAGAAFTDSGAGTFTGANRARILNSGGQTFIDTLGANSSTYGTYTIRQLSSDVSLNRTILQADTAGNWGMGGAPVSAFRLDIIGNGTSGARNTRLQSSDATTTFNNVAGMLSLKNTSATNNNFAAIKFIDANNNGDCGIYARFEDHAGAASLSFQTSGAAGSGAGEKMRISSTGLVGIGVVPVYTLDVAGSSPTLYMARIVNTRTNADSDPIPTLNLSKGSTTNTAGTNRFIEFDINNNGTGSGYASSNGANSVAFFNSSDRRLKKNIAPLTGALDLIMMLNPVTYAWKADESTATGFLAQELAEHLPQVVHKTDDGIGDTLPEGVEAWSMTESGMIPYLVKAIQELKAQLDELRGEE